MSARIPIDAEEVGAPFPLECLPTAFRDMAQAICEVDGVEAALPGCCVLGVLSASIGAGVQVLSRADRVTRGNLFVVGSAESGTGKSEAFRRLAAPLFDFEAERITSWEADVLPVLQARKTLLESELSAQKNGRRRGEEIDASERETKLAKINRELKSVEAAMVPPRLIVDNVTTEKLALLLSRCGEVLASLSSDAGDIINNLLGRYSKLDRTDESIYLKAYSGEPCRVDRVGRDAVCLRSPCLSVCWLTQPDKVETLLTKRELSDGGLVPRILLCHTRCEPQLATEEERSVPPAVLRAYGVRVTALLKRFRLAEEPSLVSPTPATKRLFIEHHNGIVSRRRADLQDVTSFAARWNEQAWRIAVCLHAGEYGDSAEHHELGEETARSAIKLADWFAGQQLEILSASREAARGEKRTKLFQLMSDRPAGVTVRDVQRSRICPTAESARAFLDGMEAEGVIHSEPVVTGGAPKKLYRLGKP